MKKENKEILMKADTGIFVFPDLHNQYEFGFFLNSSFENGGLRDVNSFLESYEKSKLELGVYRYRGKQQLKQDKIGLLYLDVSGQNVVAGKSNFSRNLVTIITGITPDIIQRIYNVFQPYAKPALEKIILPERVYTVRDKKLLPVLRGSFEEDGRKVYWNELGSNIPKINSQSGNVTLLEVLKTKRGNFGKWAYTSN